MPNLTNLIRTARADYQAGCAARGNPLGYGFASEGDIKVHVIPVQPRGMSSKWSSRADVYVGGKRLKTAEVHQMLKAEGAVQ